MKIKIILSTLLFFFGTAQAQVTVTSKKKKHYISNSNGDNVYISKDSLFLIDSDSFQHFFFSSEGGYYTLWKFEGSEAKKELEGNYSGFELSMFDDSKLVLQDCFGMSTVYEANGNIETFDMYSGDFRGGKNNKGKVALCSPSKNITEYKYNFVHSLEGYNRTWYVAGTDEGEIVIDSNGREVITEPMDRFTVSTYKDSVFIANKGSKWSIIDLNGVYQMDSQELRYPWHVFQTDGRSFANLDQVAAIFIENGKQGVIDMKGNLIVPASFDVVEYAATFTVDEETGDFIDISTYAVRKDKTKDVWNVLGPDYKELPFSIYGDVWGDVYAGNAYLTSGKKVRIFDLQKGEETSFFKEGYPNQFILRGVNYYGVVDSLGNIILPLEFRRIDRITIDIFDKLDDLEGFDDFKEVVVYIGRKGDRHHMYDFNGRCLTEEFQLESIGLVCYRSGNFFRVESNKLEGIMHYDGQSGPQIIIPVEFKSISCNSIDDPERPLAIGTKPDGSRYKLWPDGSVEKE